MCVGFLYTLKSSLPSSLLLNRLGGEEASELRGSVCSILKRARPPSQNLDKDERTVLKTLRQDRTITILPADKGNATVVMDTEEYERKVKSLLEEAVYKKVKKDPTQATERKVVLNALRLTSPKITVCPISKVQTINRTECRHTLFRNQGLTCSTENDVLLVERRH